MRLNLSFSLLFRINVFFIFPVQHLIAQESDSFFQGCFVACQAQNTGNQPLHFRNDCEEKEPTFTEMTILDVSSKMETEATAERVLYGDADVVHLDNVSSEKACRFYEMLGHVYSHFIHVPIGDRGEFIASKYPLSEVEIIQHDQENMIYKEVLEFHVNGANIHKVCLNVHDSSMRLDNSVDVKKSIVLLAGLPAAFTVVDQHFFPFQNFKKIDRIPKNTFGIIKVRRGEGGRDNSDRSGPYCEGRIDFKSGPNGTEWSVSGRAGYEDDRGNYAEGQVSRNDKGETSGSARAGHDKDK